MIKLTDELKVYLSIDPTDMRKSINGLAAIVASELEQTPSNGDVFVFCNRARNKVKCLYWDKNGFVLHYKKLDRGRLKLNRCELTGVIEITHDQLSWLLSGLDFMLMQQFPENNYAHYF